MRLKLLPSTLMLVLAAAALSAQTRVTAPENKYPISEDVKVGREGAAEVREQLPLIRDEQVASYIEGLGRRLVSGIPSEFRHDEFRYSFDVVNVRDLNAFALPGGPTFVNRGMIEAAKNEGELVGVMAHETSHVALRHGTAQQSKAAPYEWGGLLGGIVGAVVGGRLGQVIGVGSQTVLGTMFLKYGREYERQADTLGAQIMAREDYDPRDMANMFKTLEKEGKSSGPEWMSSHPNPGNRYDAITREAQSLSVESPIRNSQSFDRVKAYLKSLPKAPTMEEVARRSSTSTRGGADAPDSRPTGRVEAPSGRYSDYNAGNIFRVRVPSNWQQLGGGNTVTFAPEGAFGTLNGQSVFTHGMEIGISRNETHDLRTATEELVTSLRQSNPNLRRSSGYQRGSIDGQTALRTTLENTSDITGGREMIQLTTAETREGEMIFALGVAPSSEFSAYQPVFQTIVSSIRMNAR